MARKHVSRHRTVLLVHLAPLSVWTSVNDLQLCAAWRGSLLHQNKEMLSKQHMHTLHCSTAHLRETFYYLTVKLNVIWSLPLVDLLPWAGHPWLFLDGWSILDHQFLTSKIIYAQSLPLHRCDFILKWHCAVFWSPNCSAVCHQKLLFAAVHTPENVFCKYESVCN